MDMNEITDGNLVLSDYANGVQNEDSNITINPVGPELKLEGNTWKKLENLDIGSYTITDKTTLELEFKSDTEGEIHGIALETDDVFNLNEQTDRTFKFFGTQNGFGRTDFDDYNTSDGWKNYRINLGDFFNGETYNYLTFINDNDSATSNGDSNFRNLKLYDAQSTSPVSFAAVDSYAPVIQDDSVTGSVSVSADNSELFMEGDRWRKVDQNYTITEDTLLKFEFKSDNQGEIHGIGFDTDDAFNFDEQTDRTFQIFGTQSGFGNQDPSYTYSGSGDYESFEISLGSLAGETFENLIFINDQDIVNPTAQSYFRNVELVEFVQVA